MGVRGFWVYLFGRRKQDLIRGRELLLVGGGRGGVFVFFVDAWKRRVKLRCRRNEKRIIAGTKLGNAGDAIT